MIDGPVFSTVGVYSDGPIEDLALIVREALNAAAENLPPHPVEQEREGANHNGGYWLFALLGLEVVVMNADTPGCEFDVQVRSEDHFFAEAVAAKIARVLFGAGYKVILSN